MKNRFNQLLCILGSAVIFAGLFSCQINTKGNETESKNNGSISGSVTFSNAESSENGGIIVTLDKTDGLRTLEVSRAAVTLDVYSDSRNLIGTTATQKDGSYSFSDLEPGTYTVYAASSYSAEKAVCTNVVVNASENTIAETLHLTATGSITGKITLDNATTGNTGFVVFVAGTSFMAITDDAGNFTISGVPAGSGYQVVAMKGSVIHSLSSNVKVNANGFTTVSDHNFTVQEIENAFKGEKGDAGTPGADGKDGKDGTNGTNGVDGTNGTNGVDGKNGNDGVSINWLGSFDDASKIEKPKYLDAYFNTKDGCSYIYDGTKWTLLAKSGANGSDGKNGDKGTDGTNGTNGTDGKDGTSIVWLGSFDDVSKITNPKTLNAYFNTTDGCSYIFDGTKWNLLAKAGNDGAAGGQGTNGTNGTNGTDGKDGASIVWRGSFASNSEITNPKYLDAYYNTSDGCSYIYDGTKWTLLAKSGNSAASFAIATLLDKEELTNADVTITVNVTDTSIAKIGYVYSASQIDWANTKAVLNHANFTAITADSQGKYKITASVNGYYTVAAKNSQGFVVATEDYITNIDKTAPQSVSSLAAKYTTSTKKLTVTWTNPTDTDLDYVSLSYTKGGSSVATNVHATSPYTLNDVEVDGDEYVFTVYAVDKAGNKSTSQTASLTPAEGVKVQSITLNRYHFAYNDADQTVLATANLSNADLIEEGTSVKFQIKDSSGNVTNTTATLNKAAGTATATLTAPSTSSNSDTYGATYTVLCKIGTEAADTTHTARFNVSSVAYLTGLSQKYGISGYFSFIQISVSDVTSSTTEIVRIQGYNLDLTTPTIQLYDSTGAAYYTSPVAVDTSSVLWTASNGNNSQTIDTVIPVPTVDDTYTVKVLFNGTAQLGYTRTLQVYDVPKFTSFTIPKVSISKEDNLVTAKIIGKNFLTPDVDLGNFEATCSALGSIVADTSFTRVSDSVLNATFTIPGTAGNYSVTVTYGTKSINGTLTAADYSTYHVGDVLLNDGTIVAYDADNLSFTDTQKSKAVGVMYGFNDYGVPAGWLGLYNSAGGTNSGSYQWAKYGTAGYYRIFTDIVCDVDGDRDTVTFTGDTDGSDNWAYICSIDPDGTADAATNYPAFNYVNNYATTFGLTGDYATGWYMPSAVELYYIIRQKTVLEQVLDALGAIQLWSNYYWTSNQHDCDYYYVVVGGYSNVYIADIRLLDKGHVDLYVCCVRAF